jgi:hypothetical protein
MSTKLLIVDSEHSEGSTTNPNNFRVNITNEYLQNVRRIALVGMRTINSQYNVNENNNVIDYTYNGVDKQIIIPVGQYNITTFIDAVNGLQADFAITLNDLTLCLEWTSAGLPLTIYRNESSYEVIGVTENLVDMIGGVTLKSQLLPDLSGLSIIYVSSQALAPSNSILSNSEHSNIISSVGVDTAFGFPIYYQSETQNNADNHDYLTWNGINTIDIQLLDHNYKPCQLKSQVHLIFKIYH